MTTIGKHLKALGVLAIWGVMVLIIVGIVKLFDTYPWLGFVSIITAVVAVLYAAAYRFANID